MSAAKRNAEIKRIAKNAKHVPGGYDDGAIYKMLEQYVAKGEWKADPDSRGGVCKFKGENWPWRRRVTKDGQNFARIFHTKAGFAAPFLPRPPKCGLSPSLQRADKTIVLFSVRPTKSRPREKIGRREKSKTRLQAVRR